MSDDNKSYTIKDIEVERGHAQAEKDLRLDAEKRLAVYKDIDPAKYNAMIAELETLKGKAAAGSEEKVTELVKEAKASEAARHQKIIDDLQAKLDGKNKDLKTERVTKAILQKAAGAFGQDMLELLTPTFEKDGDFEDGEIVFKDAKGNIRYSAKDPRKPLSIDEYIEETRQKYPTAATSHAQAGSKADTQKIAGHINGKQVNSLKDLDSLPDKGKAYLQQLGQTDPKALRALMSKPN